MTQRSDLEKEARKFARELIGLLNNTVTNGIRLSTHIDQHGNAVIDYRDPSSSELGAVIPMKIDRKPARFGLRVQHTLTLEDGTGYLRNSKSVHALTMANGDPILTYDFVRDPPNKYPEAHLHIERDAATLQALLNTAGKSSRPSERLHLPVGGRRFRPSLEDLIEFCILEELVDCHDGWEAVLSEARDRFYAFQLKAAVRQHPEAAREALQGL